MADLDVNVLVVKICAFNLSSVPVIRPVNRLGRGGEVNISFFLIYTETSMLYSVVKSLGKIVKFLSSSWNLCWECSRRIKLEDSFPGSKWHRSGYDG